MTDLPRRLLTVWTALHDNGWKTEATEMPDGTFHALATPISTSPVGLVAAESLEDSAENAKMTADSELQERTGHTQCSAGCVPWQAHTIAFDEQDHQPDDE